MGYVLKAVVILGAMGLWHLSQNFLGKRKSSGGIRDLLHEKSRGIHSYLQSSPRLADFLLLTSSLGIDLAGLFLIASAVFGASFRPFLGLMILFTLRQLNQFASSLPPPEKMIWRNPGFPSLLVTYHVGEDMFFSGHTAIAVFAATELARYGTAGLAAGIALASYEILVVIVLRAHWTMDVYAGAVTALLTALLLPDPAAWFDSLLAGL